MVLGQFGFIGEVLRAEYAINSQLNSLCFSPVNQALFLYPCMKQRVFSKEESILSHIVLVTMKESVVVRNKLNYTQGIIGSKIEPINVFPTQI